MPGLLLSDDLIDTSRITGAARALGLTIKEARSVDGLLKLAAEQPPACVLVDLHFPGLDLPELRRRLRESDAAPPRLVGYGSHVDAARLKAAREAGCDLVLPRSAFFERLPQEIGDWLTTPGNPPPNEPEA